MNTISLSGLTDPSGAAHFTGAVKSSAAAPEVRKPSGSGPADTAAREMPIPANTDRYTPAEKPDVTGRYWPGIDENGRPTIFCDSPQRPEGAARPENRTGPDLPGRTGNPNAPGRAAHADDPTDPGRAAHTDDPNDPDHPEKDTPEHSPESPGKTAGDSGERRCTMNTDRVDREIEKLKQERQELERQLRSETDEAKRQKAQQRLEQVERELNQKDNDAYRRQNAVYTYF